MKFVYPLPSRVQISVKVLHILSATPGEGKIKDSLHCTRLVKCTSCFDEYVSHKYIALRASFGIQPTFVG